MHLPHKFPIPFHVKLYTITPIIQPQLGDHAYCQTPHLYTIV